MLVVPGHFPSTLSLKIPYDPDFVATIKALPTWQRSWNSLSKTWDVPVDQYRAVEQHLAAAGWSCRVLGEAQGLVAGDASAVHAGVAAGACHDGAAPSSGDNGTVGIQGSATPFSSKPAAALAAQQAITAHGAAASSAVEPAHSPNHVAASHLGTPGTSKPAAHGAADEAATAGDVTHAAPAEVPGGVASRATSAPRVLSGGGAASMHVTPLATEVLAPGADVGAHVGIVEAGGSGVSSSQPAAEHAVAGVPPAEHAATVEHAAATPADETTSGIDGSSSLLAAGPRAEAHTS